MQGVSVSELHFNFPTTSASKELESHKNPINVLFRRFFFWERPASRQEWAVFSHEAGEGRLRAASPGADATSPRGGNKGMPTRPHLLTQH